MARGVFSASNYFNTATAITAYPFTVSLWFRSSDVTSGLALFNLTELPSGDWHNLSYLSSGVVAANSVDFGGTGSASATTGANLVNDTWHHAAAVFTASNSRTAYLDGTDKGTDTTETPVNMAGLDEMFLGTFRTTTPATLCEIAEVGVWDVALDDDDMAQLGKGFSCRMIKLPNLIHYLPLVRGSQDLRGDFAEVGTVPVATSHPPIIGTIAV